MPTFITKWYIFQKLWSEMYSPSCTNTDHDTTIFEVDGMAWNIKNWISPEWNRIFHEIKEFLNLALKTTFSEFMLF